MIYVVSKNKEFKFKNGTSLYDWASKYRPYWFSEQILKQMDEQTTKESKNANSKKKRVKN